MTLRPRRFRTALAVGVIQLTLAGCTPPVSLAPHAAGSFDLITPTALSGGVSLRLDTTTRQAQTLPTTWTQASFTLSNPSTLVADRTQALPQSAFTGIGSPQTTTTLFAGTRPGTYALFASTFNNSVRNALGVASVTLTPGTTSTSSITMQTLREWTAGTLVDTTGAQGSLGNGAAPGGAQLYNPKGLTADGVGTLYVADSSNNAIRTVNSAHTLINAYTWTGAPASFTAPSALTYDTVHDVLFASQAGVTGVYYITSASASPAIYATPIPTLGVPQAMCYDATRNALYVAESNHVVERFNSPEAGAPFTGSIIVGAAGVSGSVGSGSGATVRLNSPQGLAFNGAQYLYVADTGNHRVLQVDLSSAPSYTTSTLAGDPSRTNDSGDGALAASASFVAPSALAYDSLGGGRLYVLDTASPSVRAIALPNLMIGTVFGTGSSLYGGDGQGTQQATLWNPAGMAFTGGSLFVSETGSGTAGQRVRSAQ